MKGSTIRRSIVRNTAWNYVGFAVNLAVNLVLFPVAIAQLGDAATGVWLLIGSVSGYMGLLQLGLAPAMGQFAAAHIGAGDDEALSRTVSTGLVLVTGLGSLALLALAAIPLIQSAFSIPASLHDEASLAFVLGIVGVPLQMPGHVFNAVLGAAQRQDRSTQVWMVSLLGKLIGIAVLLWFGFGLAAIMWLETGLIVTTGVMLTAFAFQAAPQLRVGVAYVSAPTARELVGLGGWTFLNALSTSLIEQTDRIVVGLFLAVDAVTHYAAAWKLYMLVYSVSTTLVQAVWPIAAGLLVQGDRHGLQQLFLRMTKYTVAVTWPLAGVLALCAGPLLDLWLGPAYGRHHLVVQVLVASFVITAHNHTAFAMLGGMRRIAPVARRYSMPQAILNLALSLILVRPLGMLGVALGTMLPVVLLQYSFTRFVLDEFQLTWGKVWHEVVRPTATPALVTFAPSVAAYALLGPRSLWLVPIAGLSAAAFALAFWQAMHESERAELVSHLPAPLRAVFVG